MPVDSQRVKELFITALEVADPGDRAAFLDRECAADPQLRRRLDVLLRAHDHPDSVVDRPLIGPAVEDRTGTHAPASSATATFGDPDATSDHASSAEAGTIIGGKYKLVEEIGEGGMGSVWVALQTEPVRRTVAVKLIKAGMDSKAVLARFEAERQALAIMDHPNIARVLDGGATPDGRPFFVMELVKGVPITQYCDDRKLTPHQRLELFIPVCQAIQHAHQKGVIHRDIKPNNVLIALYDDKPVPKVIDFGVAKATGQTLTDRTLLTGFGAVVGTPEYMSPEQASLNNLDIDTRSDVYSLGVLLYELLAGSPPFRSDELKKAGILEILRVVREEEPQRPSVKLSTANALPSISACRGTEPKKLTGLLRNELDWIVMKALEKDRSRRYETANGFAADVQRYLNGEAVQAHPPSRVYRVRKFAQKNQGFLITLTLFVGLLVVASVISGWLAVRANRLWLIAWEKQEEAEENAFQARKNAHLYAEAFCKAEDARLEAQLSATSLQVDLDLADLRTEPRVGLLRLARTLQTLSATQGIRHFDFPDVIEINYHTLDAHRAKQCELREFVTAAILAEGQTYAPLVPPITHDGRAVLAHELSPDGLTLLTLGEDGTARLWDTRTAKPIAILRQKDEQVLKCGFSPDGRTVFTDDKSEIVRFWNASSGEYRATIEEKPKEYIPLGFYLYRYPTIREHRLLLKLDFIERTGKQFRTYKSSVELWDTTTGRFIARLNRPFHSSGDFQFFVVGRWITAIDGNTVLVFSPDDGRMVAQLKHPAGEHVTSIDSSPNGQRVATICNNDDPTNPNHSGKSTLRIWNADAWNANPTSISISIGSYPYLPPLHCRFLTEDLFAVTWDNLMPAETIDCFRRYGMTEPITLNLGNDKYKNNFFTSWSWDWPNLRPHLMNDKLQFSDGRVFDLNNQQPLRPPVGRKFHPDLSAFAIDGKFIYASKLEPDGETLIDIHTEKELRISSEMNYIQGFGWVGFTAPHTLAPPALRAPQSSVEIRLIPSNHPDIPPALLQLWAQVAVRGELGSDGTFVKWDEPTWERKRQELATVPVPNPNLPFPGYVATDKLHWLRAEYTDANTVVDKLRFSNELLHRSELSGERNEAFRWRAEIDRLTPAIAPPPREVKP